MEIEFKGMLSDLEYVSLKAELNYLKEAHKVESILNKERVIFNCVDKELEEMVKEFITSFYNTKAINLL
jgi:DNA gyrase/topoisomerase IV subunit A